MAAFEEVADTFSDSADTFCDFFSSRLGSLNLAATCQSFDPAFTFDTSSRASSLRHCESTSRSAGSEVLPPAPTLLAAVSPPPCAPSRRHVAVVRRTSLPSGQCDAHARGCTPGWAARPCSSSEQLTAADVSGSVSRAGSVREACPPFAGSKRRSCPDPVLSREDSLLHHGGDDAVASCSEAMEPAPPQSPATSFASFAAALAAHYYADFGNVPDVPTHIEEVRMRAAKRQRVLSVEQVADA